jgi:hypothetical protein
MDLRWALLVVAAVATTGCNRNKGEPPPPASSALVPQAPPNAMGAMAAGKTPAPSLSVPTDPDSEEEPGTPTLPPPSPPGADAGVSL